MAEDRKTFKIKDGHLGEVKIADEVVAIIAHRIKTQNYSYLERRCKNNENS